MPKIGRAFVDIYDLCILLIIFKQLLNKEQTVLMDFLISFVSINCVVGLDMLDLVSLVVTRQSYSGDLFVEFFLD